MNNLEKILIALSEQVQEASDAAFDVYALLGIRTAFGFRLDQIGVLVGEPRNGLGDELYRTRLFARVATNNSEGTVEDLIRVAKLIAGGPYTPVSALKQGGSTLIPDVGALSTTRLDGDFMLEFIAGNTTQYRYVGLSEAITAPGSIGGRMNGLRYSWFLQPAAYGTINELSNVIAAGAYASTDVFAIKRVGTSVTYLRNGAVVYQSLLASNLPLFVDVVPMEVSAVNAIESLHVVVDGVETALEYEAPWTIGKTVTGASFDTNAFSNEGVSGDFIFECIAPIAGTVGRCIGLSSVDGGVSEATIEWMVRFNATQWGAWRSGVQVSASFSYTAGDVIQMRRVGTTIRVYQNGSLMFTHGLASSAKLFVDVAISPTGDGFSGVRLIDVTNNRPVPLTWKVLTNVSARRDVDVVRNGGAGARIKVSTVGSEIAAVHVEIVDEPINDALAATLLEFLTAAKKAGVKLVLLTNPQEEAETFAMRTCFFCAGAHSSGTTAINFTSDIERNEIPPEGYLTFEPGTGNAETVAYHTVTAGDGGQTLATTNGPFTITHANGSLIVYSDALGNEIATGLSMSDTDFPVSGGGFARAQANV